MKVGDFLAGIEPGVYILRPVNVDATGTTQRGDPMVSIQWEVDQGIYAGVSIWDNLPRTLGAGWKWASLYIAFGGSEQDDVKDLDDLVNKVLKMLDTGSTIYAKVYLDSYQGRKRPKIQEYLPQDVGAKLYEAQGRSKEQVDVPF